MSAGWSWLEIAKLVASTLTPVSVAILGLFLGRAAKRLEARQWASQKVIEKRLIIYDAMSLPLNDLLCYFSRVGNWKEQSPLDVVATKRTLDKHANVYRWLFTPEWLASYHTLMQHMFGTWGGEGYDARILTNVEKHKAAWSKAGREWDPTWDVRFDMSRVPPIQSVQSAYHSLMGCFAHELGVGVMESAPAGKGAKPSLQPPAQGAGQPRLPPHNPTRSDAKNPIAAASVPRATET